MKQLDVVKCKNKSLRLTNSTAVVGFSKCSKWCRTIESNELNKICIIPLTVKYLALALFLTIEVADLKIHYLYTVQGRYLNTIKARFIGKRSYLRRFFVN